MTDTKTYPTPAADRLMKSRPVLETAISAKVTTRRHFLGRETVARLQERYHALYKQTPPSRLSKGELVGMVAQAEIEGAQGIRNSQVAPEVQQLADLKNAARREAFILGRIADHTVERVDAEAQEMFAKDETPAAYVLSALMWASDRAYAECWRFVGLSIDKGTEPIEAAHEAIRYFTDQIVSISRGGPSNMTSAVIESEMVSGYSKFVQSAQMGDF